MASQAQIVSQMTQGLQVTEPNLDTSIGSPVRSILDVVGEVVAEAYADQYLLTYQYDVDTKSGADLDNFVDVFGFTRFPAKRATGIAYFSRATSTLTDIFISAGTQITTTTSPPVVFNTVIPVVMATGTNQIAAPIQAMLGGTTGNVSAGAINAAALGLSGVSTITNVAATSGGTDPESDDQLRARFKSTVFRAMTGTEQMFRAVALNDPDVTQVNVIGASKVYTEQIQISGGHGTSSVQYLAYLYANTSTLGVDIFGGNIVTPGSQYTLTLVGGVPTVTVIDSVGVPDGIYELQFEYLPLASRNVPASGITNRIDIYVNGTRPQEVTQVGLFSTSQQFNTTVGDTMNINNFVRRDGTRPAANNYFQPFAFSPVLEPAMPSGTITVSSTVYTEGTHFWLVNDITSSGLGPQSRSGIEWVQSTHPANNTDINLDYTINQIPLSVQKAVQNWRLVDTDVMVHQAKVIYLDTYFAVIIQPGYDINNLIDSAFTALSNYVSGITFDGVIQVSEMLSAVQQLGGITAVRMLTSQDNLKLVGDVNAVGPTNGNWSGTGTNSPTVFTPPAAFYAIQGVASPSSSSLTTFATGTGTPLRAVDIVLPDDTIAVMNNVFFARVGQNLFGAV